MHLLPRIAMSLLLATAGLAQDDLRDTVRLDNGKEVRGRVLQPYAAKEITVVQGGRRTRIKRNKIKDMQLVGDLVREFLQLRTRMRGNDTAQWFLVEWADSKELTNLARLQAMQLALDSDDERAHEFLGHRQRKGEWQWQHNDRWFSADNLAAQIVRRPITLSGERFRLRCDGDLRANINALFDLERLGVWWFDTFGEDLGMKEILRPLDVFARRDSSQFAKWGFRPMPYYVPDPHGDEARTFYAGAKPLRPQLLFYVGSQALLYRAMIGSVDPANSRDRVCPWLEVGLPMLAEHTFSGDPGFAQPGKPRMQDMQALQALGGDYRLTHLLHLPMYGGFYLMDDASTATNWSMAAMLVQYLLREDNKPQTRSAFLAYMRAALADGRGDSSSLFDKVMGKRIEDMEQPFRQWLEKVAGF